MIMGVTLPCFRISLPKAIFVIARLVGPFNEKNCDRDLENAARALRPRAAFSTLISQFFAIRTDLAPFLSALNWLTSGLFTQLCHLIGLRVVYRIILTYFMLVAFSSPVKFSKIVFPVFRA